MIMGATARDSRPGLQTKISLLPSLCFLIGLLLMLIPAIASAADGEDALDRVLTAMTASNIGGTASAPPAPTGDALLDRYAQAVDEHIMSLTDKGYEQPGAAIIPDTALAAWEPQFGQDPRYWELRYFCANVFPGQPLAPGFSKPVDLLRESQKRGIASSNTLLLLYNQLRQEDNAALDAYTGNDGPALMHEQEQRELELLNAAVAAGPDQAWTYYTRAQYWMELGSQDLVQQDLTAGNLAAQNVFPRPWPLPLLASAPGEKTPPGGAAVCGALWMAAISYPLPNYIRIKDHLREAFVCENLGGGGELEAWHQFACRFGAAAPDILIQSLVGQVLDSMISSYAEESGFGGREIQADTLLRCRGAGAAIRDIVRNTTSNQQDPVLQGSKLGAILACFGCWRGYYAYSYLDLCRERCTVSAMQPIFTDLSQVHYPELGLALGMLKYEPLTIERAKQRSEERRQQAEAEQNN
jgi:hypothetical protein